MVTLPGAVRGGKITAGKGAVTLGVQVTPSPVLVASDMANYGNSIRSFREPLERAITQVMGPSFQKNFDVGGRPPWQELAPYTRNVKQHLGQDRGILIRSGKLRRVVGQKNIWKIEGGYGSQQGRAFVQGLPGAEYGAVHQGGRRGQIFHRLPPGVQGVLEERNLGGRGDTPARPFLQFNPEDRPKIEKIFGDWHDERARRHMKLTGGI